ncbi:hypothetical protein HMPREF1531_01025 [Propionibacterium sp. oral taxon 192 str. F0372]|uniref:3-oxoacyl-[acyl-carrier-protein] synthase III C-terminal domain-containing protein n=1 Tax=Propionibacterium sp. oral taxon 192 TaxID=671222 RepID=UPI000354034E|nr:3-oxoacyl-[acyl-carrier-protein] synthase III C-terminal domain-containing protein [Propionibacterium sp. oral taxon 192]EPH05596.1 hypothetical protein HMPREF1531_01025 [Propionibacterium sp. oral taxon 192 str. F0372]
MTIQHELRPGVVAADRMMAGIAGIGVYLPQRRVDPWETLAPAGGLDPEKPGLKQYLGCWSVPLANEWDSPSSMALAAARDALREAGIAPVEVDVVISNNITSDYLDWQMSGYIADALGADATTFDIYAGCNSTGLAHQAALDILAADSSVNTVLVALAEHLGGGTFPQFIGDGACAWVLQRGCSQLVTQAWLNINDATPRLGVLRDGGVAHPFTATTSFDGEWQDNVEFSVEDYRRKLKPIFVDMCASPFLELCELSGQDPTSFDQLFIVHQQRGFNAKIVQRLGLPASITPLDCIEDMGHISGFDVMIDLKRSIAEGRIRRGNKLALLVFGLGELFCFSLVY